MRRSTGTYDEHHVTNTIHVTSRSDSTGTVSKEYSV